jgi:hypothetical protein
MSLLWRRRRSHNEPLEIMANLSSFFITLGCH